MDTLGRVYDSLGLFNQAQPLLETALATRRKLLGEDHIDVGSSLVANGSFWFHKGEFAKAKPLLERAVRVHEEILGPDDPALAACLHNLGNLQFGMGNYEEAQRLVLRALEIREKMLPADAPDTASTVNSLGAIAYRKGERATLGPKHPDLAFALSSLGDARMRLNQHAQARASYQRAVDILEAVGPNHPELGRFLVGIARAATAMGDKAAAREFSRRSLDMRERTFGKNSPEVAGSLVALANCDRSEQHYARPKLCSSVRSPLPKAQWAIQRRGERLPVRLRRAAPGHWPHGACRRDHRSGTIAPKRRVI